MTLLNQTFLVAIGLLWVLGVIVHLLGTWVSCRPKKRSTHITYPVSWEPISILKPLKGCDSGLEENLKTFFELDYPYYELLFSVAHSKDPSVPLIKKLIEQNPQVAARLIVDPVDLGPNPKVNNMVRAYEQSENDLILISDSNVRVNRNYLKNLSCYISDKNVGMVTSVISGVDAEKMGGKLEAVSLNSFYARWMRLLFFVGRPCVVGKSMLFRKSMAQRFGGIHVLGRYLAEDYMAGEAVKRLGLKVILAEETVPQVIGSLKCKDFWARHIRWGRIRKSQAFLAFLIEPFLLSTVSSGLGAILFAALLGFDPLSVFLIQWFLWLLLDIPVLLSSGSSLTLLTLGVWFLRETLSFPLWVNIALGNTVQWRGKELKLEAGGLLAAA